MLGKPRKVKVRGVPYYVVEERDALTGKRRRHFFPKLEEAKRTQEQINEGPRHEQPLHPLCDPDVKVGDYAPTWLAARRPGWQPRTGKRVRQLRVERSLGQEASMKAPKPGPTKTGEARDVNAGCDLGAVFDQIKADRPRLALRGGWRPVP